VTGGDILAELRAWRDEFARSHGYDLRAMVAALQEMDAAAGARVVRGEPRPPVTRPPGEPSPPHQALQETGAA
jgi:hypothetical protein